MAQWSETQLETQVEKIIRDWGFHTPSRRTHFFGDRSKPDFIVEESGKLIVVEVKARPPMLTDIAQISQYREPRQVGALLCIPRYALKETPKSVRSYAEQVNVRLCAVEEVGEMLSTMLTHSGSQM